MVLNYNKFFNTVNKHVTKNINEAGIVTRPVKGNGLWCHTLLPTILMLYCVTHTVTPVYSLTAFVSVGLMFYSTLFIIFMSLSSLILAENIYGGAIACSLVSTLLIYCFLDFHFLSCLLLTLPTVLSYSFLLRKSLHLFSKTFTIGEALIVVQGIVLFVFMSFAKIIAEPLTSEYDFVNSVVYSFLFSVVLMIVVLCLLPADQRDVEHLSGIVLAGASLCILILFVITRAFCITKIIEYIFFDENRLKLFTLWLILLAMSAGVLLINTMTINKANTTTRKAFHVLASLVFTTGILIDKEFITLAAGLAFGLLIFVEALRKSNIEPFSSILQSAFLVFSDDKDVGTFAMTPIYLFVGLACPLVLVPAHKHQDLELLSGVLAVGVGDTAASWFGNRYGLNKWEDTDRTMEGTLFNVLSQIITVYVLSNFALISSTHVMLRTAIAATITGLVEAKTDQVDNLILPLITIISFQITCFLR